MRQMKGKAIEIVVENNNYDPSAITMIFAY